MTLFVTMVMLLLSNTAWPHDWGDSEGTFHNNSDQTLYCYRDLADNETICEVPVASFEACQGDALGSGIGHPVFKIPNRVDFDCDLAVDRELICTGTGYWDSLIMAAAKLKNGSDKYENKSWEKFTQLMGANKKFKRCDSEGQILGEKTNNDDRKPDRRKTEQEKEQSSSHL